MADNNEKIHYTVSVDVKKAQADVNSLKSSVNSLRESFEKSDKRKKESKDLSKQLAAEEVKLTGAERNLTQAVNASAGAHRNSTKAINDQIQALVRENSTIDMNSQKYRDNQKQIAQYANKMNQAGAATGGVTSATMELSRVVSDAPYGIRGVANNLSQFTSQMYYASAAAGGLGKAFKQMWASLMGPLGVVLAITIAISALDFFAGSAKKAEEEADDLDSTLGGLANTLDGLNLSQEEENKRINEYIALMKQKKQVEEDDKIMQEKLLQINKDRDSADIARIYNLKQMNNEDLSEKMRNNAKINYDKAVSDIELLNAKENSLYDLSLANNEAYLEAKEAIGRGGKGTLLLLEQQLSDFEEQRTSMSTTSDQYKELTKDIVATQKLIDEITGGDPKKDPKKDPKFRGGKNMGSKEIDFTSENRRNNEAELLAIAEHESQKRKIRDQFEVEKLEDKKEAFVDQRNQALENFVASQELRKENNKDDLRIQEDADRLIFEAYRTAHEDIIDAETKHGDALIALKKKQKEKEREQARNDADSMFDTQQQIRENEIKRESYQTSKSGNTVEVDTFDEKQAILDEQFAFEKQKLQNFIGSAAELSSQKLLVSNLETEIFVNQAEREMAIEQAKHDFRNSMFDQAKAGFAAMSRMMKKGSDEAKAFALLEIATGTAQGMINGLIIAQDTSKKDGPMAGLTFPMYYASQVGAVLGAAARAKAILQGGPATSAAAPAPAGGGDSGFKPEFNIVGNSNENQLAQSIGNQNDAPVRAYVVYEDVSEAEGIASGSEEAAGI